VNAGGRENQYDARKAEKTSLRSMIFQLQQSSHAKILTNKCCAALFPLREAGMTVTTRQSRLTPNANEKKVT